MYRVLITEDDPMVAMINEQFVRRNKQFKVVGKVTNGSEALEFLEKQSVDLIIMDVYMPVMDGIETLKKIREKNIQTEVIMVTAANDAATFESAMRYGAVDYLVKPFVFDRFQQALDKFVTQADVLQNGRKLSQDSIDHMMGSGGLSRDEAPKGIQPKTRSVILQCLAEADSWMTGEEIAEKTSLSSVTVRRYMNYLVQSGEAEGRMNYETGGRPCMLYRV